MHFKNNWCSIIVCIILTLDRIRGYGNKAKNHNEWYLSSEELATSESSFYIAEQGVGIQSQPTVVLLGKFCTAACCKEVYAVTVWSKTWECKKHCFALRKRDPTKGLQVDLLQIWALDEFDWLIKQVKSADERHDIRRSYWLQICYDELEREDVNFGKVTSSLKNFVRLGPSYSQTCPNCPPLSNITITMRPEAGHPTCLLIKQAEQVSAWFTDEEKKDYENAGCLCQVSE